MLADLALAIERRRGSIDRVRLQKHLADVVQPPALCVAHLVELLDLAELAQHIGNVVLNFGIAYADVVVEVIVNQFGEKLLKCVRFWNHSVTLLGLPFPSSQQVVMRHLPYFGLTRKDFFRRIVTAKVHRYKPQHQ